MWVKENYMHGEGEAHDATVIPLKGAAEEHEGVAENEHEYHVGGPSAHDQWDSCCFVRGFPRERSL